MSIPLYMDEHVPLVITEALQMRGVDVLTIQEDGHCGLDDDAVISRATQLGRLLFSRDKHMLGHGKRRQALGIHFSGIVYAHQQNASIGRCVLDLELVCLAGEPSEFANRIEYLPLR